MMFFVKGNASRVDCEFVDLHNMFIANNVYQSGWKSLFQYLEALDHCVLAAEPAKWIQHAIEKRGYRKVEIKVRIWDTQKRIIKKIINHEIF
jgi:hypothetical protein